MESEKGKVKSKERETWPLEVELNGRKYRRLIPATVRGGGSWEYLSRGKWFRVYSPWLRDDLNQKAKEMED